MAKLIGCLASIVLLFGCSGSDDVEGGGEVVNIETEDVAIPEGGATVLKFSFAYDVNAVMSHGESIDLVVKLPPELAYREGTAEVQTSDGDEEVGAQIFHCLNGDTYLLFVLDEYDLDDAIDPAGDADAQLNLTVDAVASGFPNIEAAAGDNVAFECGFDFPYEAVTGVIVR